MRTSGRRAVGAALLTWALAPAAAYAAGEPAVAIDVPAQLPSAVADADGTVHLAWVTGQSYDHQAHYCRVPGGATACLPGSVRDLTPKQTEAYAKQVQIFRPGGDRVVIVYGAVVPSSATYSFVSGDGGSTFGMKKVGTIVGDTRGLNGYAIGPGDELDATGTGTSDADIAFQRTSVTADSQATDETGLLSENVAFHYDAIALAAGRPVIVWSDNNDSVPRFRAWTGAGAVTDATQWTSTAEVPGIAGAGNAFQLATGPAGALLFTGGIGVPNRVSKFDGTAFGTPVVVPYDGQLTGEDRDVEVAPDGSVHLAWRTGASGGALPFAWCYSSSTDGGATFTPPVTVGRSADSDGHLAVSAPGNGRLFFHHGTEGPIVSLDLAPDAANPCGQKPVVSTGAASALTATSATLNATVDGRGQATAVRYEHGETTSYGATSDGRLTGLKPSTTYHFRVVATNATGSATGADATFTTPTAPPGGGTQLPPKLRPSLVLTLPSTKKCASRRKFRIRVKRIEGVTYTRVEVRVNGRRVKVVKGERTTATVDLRGLPKGRYTVKIAVATKDGQTIKSTRRYRTCAPKRR